MATGQLLTLWTVRIAALLYFAGVVLYLARRSQAVDHLARAVWTAGFVFYLTHVCLAFEFFYERSHTFAYRETARQTQELFGVNSGAGLYLNYVFTLIWFADVLWWWQDLALYRQRPRWASNVIHGFLAFMFFNATAVFGRGTVRWAGIVATGATLLLLSYRRYTSHRE